MEKEIRNISNYIKRSDDTSRLVEGTAIVFDSNSEDMGFIERILPTAINEDVIKKSDVFAYLNHDASRGVLARSRYGNGSLQLDLQEDGLHYRFDAPQTPLGDELLSYLTRGEITTSSFAFSLPKEGGDRWYRSEDGVLHRDILKIERLYDVSPVFTPAYEATSVMKRKLDEIQAIEEKLDALRKEIEDL